MMILPVIALATCWWFLVKDSHHCPIKCIYFIQMGTLMSQNARNTYVKIKFHCENQ